MKGSPTILQAGIPLVLGESVAFLQVATTCMIAQHHFAQERIRLHEQSSKEPLDIGLPEVRYLRSWYLMICNLSAYALIWVEECVLSSILTRSDLKVSANCTTFVLDPVFLCWRISMPEALEGDPSALVDVRLSLPRLHTGWFLTILQKLRLFLGYSSVWIWWTAPASPRNHESVISTSYPRVSSPYFGVLSVWYIMKIQSL